MSFKDMQPGVYSLVGAGRDGFLAFSVDVLGALQDQATVPYESAAARSRAAGMTPVAYRPIQDGLQIDAGLAPPSDFNQQNVNQVTDGFLDDDGNPVADGTAPDAPPAGGGAGGGGGGLGGGGGGAGGGGGGLGGLLLGAAAGAGAAAAFDNGDSNNGQSSPSGFAR